MACHGANPLLILYWRLYSRGKGGYSSLTYIGHRYGIIRLVIIPTAPYLRFSPEHSGFRKAI
jgi:hypothetical protein